MKTQTIRLVDVFILAPFMVYVGISAKGIPRFAKSLMVGAGVLTAIYNLNNYIEKERITK